MQVKPIPDDMHRVTPHLVCAGAAQAIEFYKKAFGAREEARLPGPDGKLMHAMVRIHGDAVMLEFYNNPKAAIPDYRAIDPLALHLAFWTDDVKGTRERLIAAGATPEGDVVETPAGDQLTMLRDPWGIPIQFVNRTSRMI